MKKIYAVLLLLILLAGCGVNVGQSSDESETKDQNIAPAADIEESIIPPEEVQPDEPLEIEEPIVLYRGVTFDEADGDRNIDIPENEEFIQKKYEREYKTYKNCQYLGKYKGIVDRTALYAYWEVIVDPATLNYDTVKEGVISFYGDYNPIPRMFRMVELPDSDIGYEKIVDDIAERFGVEASVKYVQAIDLDDDGEEEYVAYLLDVSGSSSYVVLFDNKKNIISYLFACTKDPNTEFKDEYVTERMEFFDIDDDGVMEIITRMISWEIRWINVYKYDKGSFRGAFINECSSAP